MSIFELAFFWGGGSDNPFACRRYRFLTSRSLSTFFFMLHIGHIVMLFCYIVAFCHLVIAEISNIKGTILMCTCR